MSHLNTADPLTLPHDTECYGTDSHDQDNTELASPYFFCPNDLAETKSLM